MITYPVAEGDVPAGDFILKSIPEEMPKPNEFVKDSHHILNHVMQGIKDYFGVYNPHVVREWEEWVKHCPQTDDVNEYIKDFPMHVPLRNTLFAPLGTVVSNRTTDNINDDINNTATHRTQPVVQMGSKQRRASKVPIIRLNNGVAAATQDSNHSASDQGNVNCLCVFK